MGLTKNLGWLSKYITADSTGAGLIGIGASSGLVEKLTLDGNMLIKSGGGVKFNRTDNLISTDLYDAGTYFALNNRNGNGFDFQSAGASVVKISASNHLGVGVASPNFRLDVSSGTAGTIAAFNSTRVGGGGITLMNNSAARAYIGNANWVGISGEGTSSTAIAITSAENSAIIFGTNAAYAVSEKMRIFSSGNVFIGPSPSDNGARLRVSGAVYASGRLSLGDGIAGNFNAINIASGIYTNTAAISIGVSNPTGGVVSPIITFNAPNDSYSYAVRGGMYYNGSNLQMEFRTTSDYRVKEDLIEDFNAIDLLDKIKIYDHKWIGASGRSYSVIAHELQNVIPYLVSGQKDAILDDGSMDLQSVDYSKLVPILIKGIQELTERIKTLENK